MLRLQASHPGGYLRTIDFGGEHVPYIEESIRADIDPEIDRLTVLLDDNGNHAGNLVYAITRLVLEHVASKGISFTNMNEIMGCLESTKHEFYRAIVSPYEDRKKDVNGDVRMRVR